MNMVIMHLSVLKERKSRREITNLEKIENVFYANEEDDSNEKATSDSNDEIIFVAIKEESPKKISLVSQVKKKYDQIIEIGCSHHMTGNRNKFVDFKSQDGGIVKVGHNKTCQVKGIGSITLDGKNNIEDVYFFDGLKKNL